MLKVPLVHGNNFDLLRLFAAMQVFYMHGVATLELPRGGLLFQVLAAFPGVPVFFVISGFLVTDSYLRSSVPGYALKRVIRIYPALIANIIVLELAMYVTGGLPATSWPTQYAVYLAAYMATASPLVGVWVSDIPAIYSVTGFFKEYPRACCGH